MVAVDRNVTLLQHLHDYPNLEIVEAPIEGLDLLPASMDLIHTRNVLMHIDGADGIIPQLVDALRPGGVLLLEEADYFPLAGMTSAALAEVATRWRPSGCGPARSQPRLRNSPWAIST